MDLRKVPDNRAASIEGDPSIVKVEPAMFAS